jgi:hypothetical protein
MRVRLKDRMFTPLVISMLVGVCLSIEASPQSTDVQKKTKSASQTAEIAEFFTEKPKRDSKFETGSLHIIYGDRTEIVKTLPSPKASAESAAKAVGFSGVQLAEDRRTLGWTINVENCCTSYSIPFSVVVFRYKQVLHTFDQGQMVWSWMFVQGGKQVAVVFGPTHGSEVGDYRLYDVKTGKLISEVRGEVASQALEPNAPKWAKLLENHFHSN